MLQQQWLDATTPAGKAMFQMMGVFAEFERAMIAERVRAGLARARGEGKRLGRPPIAPALEKRIREALAVPGRPGVRVIAKQFGVDPGTGSGLAALSPPQASPPPCASDCAKAAGLSRASALPVHPVRATVPLYRVPSNWVAKGSKLAYPEMTGSGISPVG